MTSTQPTDESLYAAYHKGDKAAFDGLYARYRQPLYLFLLRRGHDEAAAEDIFHDGWMKVVHQQQKFDGQHFRGWIYQVMRNLSIDSFRKRSLHSVETLNYVVSELTHPSAQQKHEGIDCLELMKRSVAALPMDQRDVFLLKEEAGLSLMQIAELMTVGRETIKSRIRYAMKQLKQMLAECL